MPGQSDQSQNPVDFGTEVNLQLAITGWETSPITVPTTSLQTLYTLYDTNTLAAPVSAEYLPEFKTLLWDVFDETKGTDVASSAIVGEDEIWFSSLMRAFSYNPSADALAGLMQKNIGQDGAMDEYVWLGEFETKSPDPVPEPVTMLLLGSGLVGLARINRKKLFKNHR